MSIEQQCEAALKRLHEFINRSTAQHLRYMRQNWSKYDNA